MGIYVDVGCYHPLVGSNTYILYKKYGWSGINIDANPESISLFRKKRPNDLSLNYGVGSTENTQLTFHRFTEPALNTFSEEFKNLRIRQGANFLNSLSIPIKTLDNILGECNLENPIDVLDIDVEGLDMEVIKSLDLNKHKPNMILIEDQTDTDNITELPSYNYLVTRGYKLLFKSVSTAIYLSNEFSNI